ncbi:MULTISPECIES: cysteine--1-D-myo-inosityl 2-amino-2-deoxy-alpha-D-glucopyranoside ligase [unclassified Cryobacterium]|uniref:cysteine--1-D-myo-inosityl 2-amino-2-deoxy-alpha-D-glucopyranoside ligase n=1 Tax=unclassified Cryobacterium TaxID=2649013 RepID=UPI002AB404D6|nr:MULTISPECIES: cysteine--1-D-myo-inosityl 2-amino-2-deoxy-alpha-D-glucopyranoside ligase [unclassified Cryobacterium]MDY7527770.1 cysteine--1-D-myo-inosityl 2-amino-2-deoxy-alpha-D-glucopyranoside ligase [Cryobacterium sp. 10C2]MEB0001728.1 cysteine--1-D-myo-inosityl 2-amino-2-deoxy-alpha-D-glucopyranoside ligase [Cryobacterium sp. RTC2.1]MEB0200201.1 cysteine--1-D-myo-inosityl 2-amino-2-deoxy-alpha-D-glucopyranoside ligase [Cryobacterium sp. 5I3]MEB0289078.1 cysteine--1-D-myo-inosityl 2-amin
MRAWRHPDIPVLPGNSEAPHLYDTATEALVLAEPVDVARLYVCGITPYDATHIGHANTYLAFDTLQRVWLDAGYRVHYAQNVTDVDDPLLERATATGVDWRDLAASQVDLFRTDMEALGIIPPDNYVAVTEVIEEVADAVAQLWDDGLAYAVAVDAAELSDTAGPAEAAGSDIYFDIAAAERVAPWQLGDESNLDREQMLTLFAQRGGDPDREGKRDALDPLLWRAARVGEPAWDSRVGAGRPGWHIECSVIALTELGTDFTVQGGGSDLIFPHHDMSAGHAAALSGHPLAGVYSHTGMVAYQGEKMSKSLGNLVLVSALRAGGTDPRAIRLALLAQHYRSDWEWTTDSLSAAEARLEAWTRAFGRATGDATAAAADGRVDEDLVDDVNTDAVANADEVIVALRAALVNDLDTPAALRILDAAAEAGTAAPELVALAIDALLGITL